MNDPKYFKKENYIKEVERWVDELDEWNDVDEVKIKRLDKYLSVGAKFLGFCVGKVGWNTVVE